MIRLFYSSTNKILNQCTLLMHTNKKMAGLNNFYVQNDVTIRQSRSTE